MKERIKTKKPPISKPTKSLPRNKRPARPSTTSKRTEASLRESEKRYRSLFDNILIGLYRTTPKGKIMEANPALVQMLGFADRDSFLKTNAVCAGTMGSIGIS